MKREKAAFHSKSIQSLKTFIDKTHKMQSLRIISSWMRWEECKLFCTITIVSWWTVGGKTTHKETLARFKPLTLWISLLSLVAHRPSSEKRRSAAKPWRRRFWTRKIWLPAPISAGLSMTNSNAEVSMSMKRFKRLPRRVPRQLTTRCFSSCSRQFRWLQKLESGLLMTKECLETWSTI